MNKYHIDFDIETKDDKDYVEYILRKQLNAKNIYIQEKK